MLGNPGLMFMPNAAAAAGASGLHKDSSGGTSTMPMKPLMGMESMPPPMMMPMMMPGMMNGMMRMPQQREAVMRRGKWTAEEEVYCNQLIQCFKLGMVTDCEEGCTLRSYLASKLHCAPMRISKKYAGTSVGKLVYQAAASDSMSQQQNREAEAEAKANLEKSRAGFLKSISDQGDQAGLTASKASTGPAMPMMMPMGPFAAMMNFTMMNNMQHQFQQQQKAFQQMQKKLREQQQQQQQQPSPKEERQEEFQAAAAAAPLANASAAVQPKTAEVPSAQSSELTLVESLTEHAGSAVDMIGNDKELAVGQKRGLLKLMEEADGEDEAITQCETAPAEPEQQLLPPAKKQRRDDPGSPLQYAEHSWLSAEEAYCRLLVREFKRGHLADCFRSCSLQAYLATKLRCDVQHVEKKVKQRCFYRPNPQGRDPMEQARVDEQLRQLASNFQVAALLHAAHRPLSLSTTRTFDFAEFSEDEFEDGMAHVDEMVDDVASTAADESKMDEEPKPDDVNRWSVNTPGIWVPVKKQSTQSRRCEGPSHVADAAASTSAETATPSLSAEQGEQLEEIAQRKLAWAVADANGAFSECNALFTEVTGYARSAVVRSTLFSLMRPEDTEVNMGVLNMMLNQDSTEMPAQFQIAGVSKDGRLLAIMLQRQVDKDGTTAGINCCAMRVEDAEYPLDFLLDGTNGAEPTASSGVATPPSATPSM